MEKRLKKARCVYSVDWMQLFCSNGGTLTPSWEVATSPMQDEWGNHRTYRLATSTQFIKGYEWQRKVIYRNYDVAYIASIPRDERVRKDACAIKLANAVLYVSDWYFILHDILFTLGWNALNITRCDLCCDLCYFVGGLLPETFIRNYMSKTKSTYLRIGSNKWACYGKKDMYRNTFESIRWGSRQSGVSVYLYNKTKELREVKDKPYIRRRWEEAQLPTTLDVWRVEVSISSQSLGLKSIYNSTIHTLFTDDLRTPELVARMFQNFAAKYFRFVKVVRGARRKRDLPEVQLLNFDVERDYKPISLQESHDTGRMERIVSNKLTNIYNDLIDRDFVNKEEELQLLQRTITIFNNYHNIKSHRRQREVSILKAVTEATEDVYSLPSDEEMIKRIGTARKHIEELKQEARTIAKQTLANCPYLHPDGSRNGHNVTTSTPCR